MSQYYNKTTNELTTEKPDVSFTDAYWKEVHGDNWEIVDDTFVLPLSLSSVKLSKLNYLDTSAASAYVAGFESDASGAYLWYDSDKDTQLQITSAALLAMNITFFNAMYPDGAITIRAKATKETDDSLKQEIAHTANQIITLATDMQAMLKAKKDILWARQKAVNEATTVEEVDAIVW